MRPTKLLYLSVIGLILSLGLATACAQDHAAQEPAASAEANPLEASLLQAISDYDEAVAQGNAEQLVKFGMSPKVLAHLAAEEGHPAGAESHETYIEGTRAAMIAAIDGVLKAADEFEYQYDLENPSFQTADTGLQYVRLPTVTNIQLPNIAVTSTGETIAVLDDGQWYFLNPQDAETIEWMKAAYPELQDLQIEPNNMETAPR